MSRKRANTIFVNIGPKSDLRFGGGGGGIEPETVWSIFILDKLMGWEGGGWWWKGEALVKTSEIECTDNSWHLLSSAAQEGRGADAYDNFF